MDLGMEIDISSTKSCFHDFVHFLERFVYVGGKEKQRLEAIDMTICYLSVIG
jgi:hypothetical protein